MTREVLRSDLRAIAGTVSGQPMESWDDQLALVDLGIDSADLLEMVAELEDRLSIEIPLHTLERLATVGELLTEILARVEAR
jgi:acyl carrier protein